MRLKSSVKSKVAILCLFFTTISSADVTVETVEFRGWKGCAKLTNDVVELIVVPQIGRIMHFGFKGKQNVLWVNESLFGAAPQKGYLNWGGDKVWWAPQADWQWPPDAGLDGSAFEMELTKTSVRLKSPLGKRHPVRLVREITLAPFGPEARMTNALENRGAAKYLSVWQVTQIDDPSEVVMPIQSTGKMPSGFNVQIGDKLDSQFHIRKPDALVLKRSPDKAFKFGAKGSGELIAKIGNTGFTSKSETVRKSAYPDGDSAQEVFTSPNPAKYVELEHLSPLIKMEPRQVAIQKVTWRLK